MTSWAARHAKPSPGKKKAFKVMVVLSAVFWIPVFAFVFYKGVAEPLFVLADKHVTLAVMVRDLGQSDSSRYVRQKYLYAANGEFFEYQGSRMKGWQSPKRVLKIWHSRHFPKLAFIPEMYFVERFRLLVSLYGVLFLIFAYVRFIRKEPMRVYLARRIREEVG